MNNNTVFLDPRAEELLHEIAADPESCLLRAPRSAVMSAVLSGERIDQQTSLYYSKAERELLRSHRSEVAYWLRVACAKRLYERPDLAAFVSPRSSAQRRIELPTDRHLVKRVEESLAREAESMDISIGERALVSAVAAGSHCSVLELASASLRLVPSPNARNFLSIASVLEGRVGFARRLLEREIAQASSSLFVSLAWANLGWTLTLRGNPMDGSAAYERAWQLHPANPGPLLDAFASALLSNHGEIIRRSAATAQGAGVPDMVWLEFQWRWQALWHARRWSLSPFAKREAIAAAPQLERWLDALP